MKTTKELQGLISNGIDKLDLNSEPKELYEPISYILSLGGKRLRPLLVLLAYQLQKDDVEGIINPALSVELFHNFTLMHDDIMDEAPLRRGQPTVHEKWDTTVGILSGDAMMVKSYDLLCELQPEMLRQVLPKFNRCALEVCEGQQFDMLFESREKVSVDEYLDMIRLKTAVLLGFSLEFGGIMSGMNNSEARKLRLIGENMGLGFQLMDDFLDVYADKGKFGKQVGGDIVANKKTYLLISALKLANSSQLTQLHAWLSKKEFDVDEKVNAVKALYDEIGVKALSEERMNAYFDRAFEDIERINGDEKAKSELIAFATFLMNRQS